MNTQSIYGAYEVMNTKEGTLVSAVLMYAMRCLAEGDMLALQHMQFGEKEVQALRDLRATDLYRVESMKAHCLSIALNRQVFWPMINLLNRDRRSEDLLTTLIEMDAPFEMLRELYGMSSREYSTRRRHLPSTLGQGRPQLPKRDIEDKLYSAWRKVVKDRDSYELTAAEYLALHEQTKVSIRAIWRLVARWTKEES